MFWKKKLDPTMLDITSKMGLKVSCLKACDNNVDEALKLFNYMMEGVTQIPDFPTVPPTTFEQIKRGAGDLFSWVKQNRDDIFQAWQFVKTMRQGNAPVEPTNVEPTDIPPLPTPDNNATV
jgi:hypothetical protein